MKPQPVIRDERTLAVENSSYRWAYFLLTFGLLVIVAYRSFVWHESNWDLLALVILSGVVTSLYQGANRVLSHRWAWMTIAAAGLAASLAAAFAFLRPS
jgi:hypothetical protein